MNVLNKLKKKKYNYKKIFTRFLFFLLIVHLSSILYFNRELFFQDYDKEYWRERFEHSQWQIPLSTRSISDDTLFSYVGYEQINGLDPTSINVETPPLGKYIFGLSIHIFNNALYLSFISYLLIIGVLYVLFKNYIKEKFEVLLLVLVIILNPLIYSQGYITLLDNFQLLFLILSFVFLNLLKNKKSNSYLFLAGASLGLFFGTKFPLIFPIFFIYESYIILRHLKIRKKYLSYLFGLSLFILIPYFKFFVLGNSIIDFLKIQKFIINFYAISKLEVQEGAVWIMLMIGKLPDLVSGELHNVEEWIVILPIILILFFLYLLRIIRGLRNKYLLGLYVSVILSLVIYSFVPFYARYLVVILPFIYLFAFLVIENKKARMILFLILLIVSFINSINFLKANPKNAIYNFSFNIENQNFNDIFELQLASEKPFRDRNEFHKAVKSRYADATIEYIKPSLISVKKRNRSELAVVMDFEYFTRYLGSFSERKEITFIKENSKWKPLWNWSIVLNDLDPDSIIIAEREVGLRGAIYDEDNKLLVRDEQGYLISINPKIYDSSREEELTEILGDILFIAPVNIQNGYLDDPVLGYVDLGTNYRQLSDDEIKKLEKYKGLRLEEQQTRIYYELDPKSIRNEQYPNCCRNIYSSSMYHGVSGIEEKFEEVVRGSDGGRILIVDQDGNVQRIVLEKTKKDGQDLYLNNVE